MIKDYIQESIELNKKVLEDKELLNALDASINKINKCFQSGNKILIAGNGGSAADAQHFAAEIVCRFKRDRKGYGAIALTTDSSILTAWTNDIGFDSIFSRQIEALGNKDDIFIGISTSGNSQNIIEATKRAKDKNILTIGLLGNKGGRLINYVDLPIIVPSSNTPRIQEVHELIIHIICEEVEKNFL